MTEIQCPTYTWCDERSPSHVGEDVHGVTFDVVAGESSVNVSIHRCDRSAEDSWHLSIDFGEWCTDAETSSELGPEIDREFTALRSIVDQIEARVRAFHAANVGTAIKRPSGIREHMEHLADR